MFLDYFFLPTVDINWSLYIVLFWVCVSILKYIFAKVPLQLFYISTASSLWWLIIYVSVALDIRIILNFYSIICSILTLNFTLDS